MTLLFPDPRSRMGPSNRNASRLLGDACRWLSGGLVVWSSMGHRCLVLMEAVLMRADQWHGGAVVTVEWMAIETLGDECVPCQGVLDRHG
jgi:hypothetical protein